MRKHFFLFFLIGLIACKKEVELNQNSKISKITTGNGPEDIIIDESISPARILVSCSARRDNQTENGEIYQLNYNNDNTSILPRIGKPENFVFNPHGIDIYKNGNESFLYVISHYAIDSVDVIANIKSNLTGWFLSNILQIQLWYLQMLFQYCLMEVFM
ncbi:MAG: hypothetical protein IPH74_03420 [Bacteroidetes bacterium]|nr:hypothetical protein [Bacteroidota bacterium]